jgi:hypothetical protein
LKYLNVGRACRMRSVTRNAPHESRSNCGNACRSLGYAVHRYSGFSHRAFCPEARQARSRKVDRDTSQYRRETRSRPLRPAAPCNDFVRCGRGEMN